MGLLPSPKLCLKIRSDQVKGFHVTAPTPNSAGCSIGLLLCSCSCLVLLAHQTSVPPKSTALGQQECPVVEGTGEGMPCQHRNQTEGWWLSIPSTLK